MSMPEGRPQTEMLDSNLHIDAVTALSLVTPDGIVTPSDCPEAIPSVNDCGEDDEGRG